MTAPGLIHFPDTRPGITRHRTGRGFSYRSPDGTRIDSSAERARIAALAVPPAYKNVWICPKPNGHLQATGRDDRARKQYRYHPDWTSFRSLKKYGDLPRFGEALPRIRRAIADSLRGEAGSRDFAIAAILAMLDRLSLRIGQPEYAAENGSYGATTLKHRHLRMSGGELRLAYTAKGGQKVRRSVRDATLQRSLHRLDDLPGATLVSWLDDAGVAHEVSSGEVNDTLARITGTPGLTAKTFRTWNGSAAAMEAALASERLTIRAMADAASERLANTPTIARNSYIHPDVIALADLPFAERVALAERAPEVAGLRRSERTLLGLLGS